nr:MAG TPA: hypothetical protein [Caudoviricetes sp.]
MSHIQDIYLNLSQIRNTSSCFLLRRKTLYSHIVLIICRELKVLSYK